MAENATLTTLEKSLERLFRPEDLKEMSYLESPLWGRLSKDEKFTGFDQRTTLKYGSGQGVSATFANAQANRTANKYEGFILPRYEHYGIGRISGHAIAASQGSKLAQGLDAEIEGVRSSFMTSLMIHIWRNGGGHRGQIKTGTSVTAASITLADPSQAVNFEVGQVIKASATDGTSGAVRAGFATISAIDPVAGTLTTDTAATWDDAAAIPAIAALDYLFVEGDFGKPSPGIGGYIAHPSVNLATSFLGVTRSKHTTRLGGIRFDGSALPIREAVKKGLTQAWINRAKLDDLYLHPDDWDRLELSFDGNPPYIERASSDLAHVGYKGIKFMHHGREVACFSDPYQEKGWGFGLQLDTWKVRSAGMVGQLRDPMSGIMLLRAHDADDYEFRFRAYYALECNAPGFNIRIKLSSLG